MLREAGKTDLFHSILHEVIWDSIQAEVGSQPPPDMSAELLPTSLLLILRKKELMWEKLVAENQYLKDVI